MLPTIIKYIYKPVCTNVSYQLLCSFKHYYAYILIYSKTRYKQYGHM
jgi:hypothetical protein